MWRRNGNQSCQWPDDRDQWHTLLFSTGGWGEQRLPQPLQWHVVPWHTDSLCDTLYQVSSSPEVSDSTQIHALGKPCVLLYCCISHMKDDYLPACGAPVAMSLGWRFATGLHRNSFHDSNGYDCRCHLKHGYKGQEIMCNLGKQSLNDSMATHNKLSINQWIHF